MLTSGRLIFGGRLKTYSVGGIRILRMTENTPHRAREHDGGYVGGGVAGNSKLGELSWELV